jgi:hypothetical protein
VVPSGRKEEVTGRPRRNGEVRFNNDLKGSYAERYNRIQSTAGSLNSYFTNDSAPSNEVSLHTASWQYD